MGQRRKIDLIEKRFEEYATVSKRAALCLFETAMFYYGLYHLFKLVFHF
jgi:hypothetical protein